MNICDMRLCLMEGILAISHELVGSRTLDEILHQIVQIATKLVDCETVGILLLDEQANTLRFVAVTQHAERIFDYPVPIDNSIAGAAFTSNQPVIVHNVDADPRHYATIADTLNYPTHSLLAVPLTFRERKIGVLEAENKKNNRHFDESDTLILTALATQATIAIENARQAIENVQQMERYKQMAQAEQQQRHMADALRLASAALASSLDYNQVIDRILEQVSQIIPGDTNNVMLIESGNLARVFRGRGYESVGTAETLNDTLLNIATVAGLRQMCDTKHPIVIPDVQQDPNWVYSRPEHRWIRSYIGAPIIVREHVLGFLNVMNVTPNCYDASHAQLLQTFAHHAASAIDNARLYSQAQAEIAERIKAEEELRRHRDQLEALVKERTAEIHRLAITDPLTDLFNRRHLIELGNRALNHAQRYQHPLSVMMIDIDHFKKINDIYGHAMGDEALHELAKLMLSQLRLSDIVGRYGGEEFVVILPETNLQAAHKLAERLLLNIRTMQIAIETKHTNLTASIGLVERNQVNPQKIDLLISYADQAMYAAKQAGRDRVVVYE